MKLELAKLEEFDDFFSLKSDKSNVTWTGWSKEPNYDNLKDFYTKVVNNNKTLTDRKIYLAHEGNNLIGYVYIDYVDDSTFHLSPAIYSDYQGKGYGKKIIELGINEGLKLGFKNMEAYIREDNIASQKCFEANGAIKTDIYRMQFIENLNKELKMIKYYYESK